MSKNLSGRLRYSKTKRRNWILVFSIIFACGFPKIVMTHEQQNYLTEEGYWLDDPDENFVGEAAEAAPATGESLVCPSVNVIRTRYKCKSTSDEWVDCTRSHCCPGFNFIGGKCLPDSVDPCTLSLCEQRCTVLLQRVICTCWDGYRFSAERQKQGDKPVCVEVDECNEGTADCEQQCINSPPGSFSCGCNEGFVVRLDNKTCEKKSDLDVRLPALGETLADDDSDREMGRKNPGDLGDDRVAAATRCYASCDTVLRIHDKVKTLQEKLSTLGTAIRLSSFSSGTPGPTGPPGPPGPPGPRGFPGDDLSSASEAYSNNGDKTRERSYSIIDSFVQTEAGYCKCQRGPIVSDIHWNSPLGGFVNLTFVFVISPHDDQGPSGPPGATGPKGDTGEQGSKGARGATGSFDFLLLLLADLRHDVVHLQEKVFQGETFPRFDFESVLKKQNLKDANKDDPINDHSRRRKHDHKSKSASTVAGSIVDEFEASSGVRFSDYASVAEAAESSGEEWEYED